MSKFRRRIMMAAMDSFFGRWMNALGWNNIEGWKNI